MVNQMVLVRLGTRLAPQLKQSQNMWVVLGLYTEIIPRVRNQCGCWGIEFVPFLDIGVHSNWSDDLLPPRLDTPFT